MVDELVFLEHLKSLRYVLAVDEIETHFWDYTLSKKA